MFFKLSKNCGFLYPLPLNTRIQEVLAVVRETLYITEPKNLFKGECVHHGALERQLFACPVKALARRLALIRLHTSDITTILCAYWDSVGRGDVTDRDMIFQVKLAAAELGYPSRNILLNRIDTHSNRAGRTCAMKLAGFDDDSIRKMGIWLPSSNVFLEYIQHQLFGFSQCMATKMSSIAIFTNMEGSENHTG